MSDEGTRGPAGRGHAQGLRAARLRPARGHARATSAPRRRQNPDVRFIVYHSGYDIGDTQRPTRGDATADSNTQHGRRADQEPAREQLGRARRSSRRARRSATCPTCRPSSARSGATSMNDPDQAAHLLGKLITHVGPEADRVGHRQPLVRLAAAGDRRPCAGSSSPSEGKELYDLPLRARGRRRGPDAQGADARAHDPQRDPRPQRRAGLRVDPDARRHTIDCDEVQELSDEGYLRGDRHRARVRAAGVTTSRPARARAARCRDRWWRAQWSP